MQNSASSKSSKILNLALATTMVATITLAIINLVGANILATQGVVIDDYATKTQALIKTNSQLQVDIAKSTNLGYLENKAIAKGFARIKSKIVLEGTDSLASSR